MHGRSSRILDVRCPVDWAHPLNRGLVAEWAVPPLSGWRGGLTLRDLVRGGKNPHNGTLTNGPTWVGGGRPGGYGALNFTRSSSQSVATTLALPDHKPFTVIGYGRYGPTTGVGSTSNCNVGSFRYLAFREGTQDVAAQTYDGSSFFNLAAGSGLLNGDVFCAQVWDGATHSLFVFSAAGVATASQSVANFNDSAAPLTLGSKWNGLLYSSLVFTRALSAAEIAALYDQSRRGNPDRWNWVRRVAYSAPVAASQSATLACVATVTARVTVNHRAVATLACASTGTVNAVRKRYGAAALACVSTLTGTVGSHAKNGTATITCVATLTASGTRKRFGAATLACVATVTSNASVNHRGVASLACVATVTASGTRKRFGAATLACVTTVTASGTVSHRGVAAVATLAGVSTVTVGGTVNRRGIAALTCVATVTATATVPVTVVVQILTYSFGTTTELTGTVGVNARWQGRFQAARAYTGGVVLAP